MIRLHCLLPALQLLDTCRQWSSPDQDIVLVEKSLEKLLVDHVILPFRDSVIHADQTMTSDSGESRLSFSDELTLTLDRFPLVTEHFVSRKKPSYYPRSVTKTKVHLTLAFLVHLFEIALIARPRHLPNLRRMEDSWLENFFDQLTIVFNQIQPHTNGTRSQKDYARLVRWMLRKALDHKLYLSLPNIEMIINKLSGLFTPEHDIEWGIINLCLLSDANAFIVPASSSGLSNSKLVSPPNRILSTLLSELTNISFRSSPDVSQKDYDYAISHVAIPLSAAFSDGRDLLVFLSYWREQVNVYQEAKSYSVGKVGRSIWEEQRLLNSVAQSIETTLTPGQIDQLVSSTAHDLKILTEKVPENSCVNLGGLILLDCIFAGISGEEIMARMMTTAQSVFSLLGVILSSNYTLLNRWRMWRIQGVIAERWIPIHSSLAFKQSATSAISRAVKLTNSTVLPKGKPLKQDKVETLGQDFTETLYALNYTLSYIGREEFFGTDPQAVSCKAILSAVQIVIDAMEPFCKRIEGNTWGTKISIGKDPELDSGKGSRAMSLKTLYINLVGQILSLRLPLDPQLQRQLIKQLYWFAVYQQSLWQRTTPDSHSIDFSSPWNCLMDSNRLVGIPPISGNVPFLGHLSCLLNIPGCLSEFLVDRFEIISQVSDPNCWNMDSQHGYLVAFNGLGHLPISEFSQIQSTRVANSLLRLLLQTKLSTYTIATDHIVLLAKLTGNVPNDTMDILLFGKNRCKTTTTHIPKGIGLVDLACKINESGHRAADAVEALKLLTSSTLRQVK